MVNKIKNIFKRLAHLASLLLHPVYSFHRLREVKREIGRKEIKPQISLESLPEVKLVAVNGNFELEERLISVYSCNPSILVSGPMERKTLREKQQNNFEFFLVIDEEGNDAAAISFDNNRSISCHLVTSFSHRSKGLGIAAMLKLEKIKIDEGINIFWGQVYKNNPRMLSLVLSIGYKIVEEESTPKYYTIKKTISSDDRL